MNTINVAGSKRTETGKKATKATRREGLIPAIVYGGDAPEGISVKFNEVKKAIYTPDFNLVDIDIEGKTVKTIVKDVQFHPVTDEILHIDFLRVIPGTPLKVNIPIGFKGVSPGVKLGGRLVQQMRRLPVKTTPDHLVDIVKVDISKMDLGGVVRVREVELSDGIQVMANGATPIATVEIPRALKSAAAADAKGENTEEAPAV